MCRTYTHINRRRALRELKLTKHINPDHHPIMRGRWPIPDPIYDALHHAFNIQRVLECSPMDLPINATEYYTRDPDDIAFSAGTLTATAWTGISLSLPEHTAEAITHSLEQAMYSAHHHKHKSPSATLLLLPSWQHTPYLSRNLQTSYAQKLTSIPYYPRSELARDTKYDLDIYLVANQKALAAIDPNKVQTRLDNAIRQTYGALHSKITITTTRPDPTSLDSHI